MRFLANTKTRNSVFPAALALFCALSAVLSSTAFAGAKDVEFARGLLKRKWYDLADKIFKELSQSGKTEEDRKQGELGQIEVLKLLAEEEPDAEKKKGLFADAIKRYKKFLEGSADLNAQFNLAELLKSKGNDFTTLAADQADEKEKKKLQEEAAKSFSEAVELIKASAVKMKENLEKKGWKEEESKASDEEIDQYQRAAFYHAELHYDMAKIFEGSQEKKIAILNDAIKLFEEFLWEFEGYTSSFFAYIKKGQCFVEMGQYEKAIDAYKSVMGLDKSDDEEGAEKPDPEMMKVAETIIKKAYYRIIEALNLAQKYDMALAEARKMEEKYPKLLDSDAINLLDAGFAVIEKAKAFAGKAEYSNAIGAIMPLVKMAGIHARSAVKLLAEWGSRDPTASVEVTFTQGEGLLQSGEFGKAVEAFEDTISKLSTPEEMKGFGSRTWHELGIAYAAQRRWFEAGLAFEEGERVWGEGRQLAEGEEEWGSACAYRAYSAFKAEFDILKTDHLKNLYAEKRTLLTTKYPNSKYAKNLGFFAAQDKMAEDKFLEAIDLFNAVDKVSEYFEDAQSRIGRCYFGQYELLKKEEDSKLEKLDPKKFAADKAAGAIQYPEGLKKLLDDAEAKLLAFIELTNQVKVEGLDQKQKRLKSMSITMYYLGRIYDEKNDPEKVLKYLEEFDVTYKDMPDMVLPATFLRLRASYLKRDSRGTMDMLRVLEETDNLLRTKQGRKKSHLYLVIGFQLAGKLCSELAAQAKVDGQMELAAELSDKAAEYLWRWIQASVLEKEGINPAEAVSKMDAVGIKQFQAGEYDKAALIYDTILKKFGANVSDKQKKELSIKLSDCYIKMENWEMAKVLLEELYKASPKVMVFIEKLVFVYDKYGDKFKKEHKENESHQEYNKALDLYGTLLKPPNPEKTEWWEWKVAVWKIMFKKGLFKDIVDQTVKIKALYPELGGAKTKKAIEDLEAQAKEKAR